jgi:hypothetical protein
MGIEITGWGKCIPPTVLKNKDLENFIFKYRRRYAFSPTCNFYPHKFPLLEKFIYYTDFFNTPKRSCNFVLVVEY